MPIPTIVQNPSQQWDYVSFFPFLDPRDNLPASPALAFQRFLSSRGEYHNSSSRTQFGEIGRMNNSAAAGWAFRANAGGPPYLQLESAGAGRQILGLDDYFAAVDTGSGIVTATGAQLGTYYRNTWLKWLMQCPTGTPTVRTGILFCPVLQSNNHVWPDLPAGVNNTGGFGFVGDGIGQWRYASYNRVGALVLREAIALPAHNVAEWNSFEIQVINARPGIPATIEAWFNGSLVAVRNWLGADLEDYVANEWRFMPVMCGGNPLAAGAAVNITSVECRKGAYTRDGVPL